jgi:hypothetical protein
VVRHERAVNTGVTEVRVICRQAFGISIDMRQVFWISCARLPLPRMTALTGGAASPKTIGLIWPTVEYGVLTVPPGT